MEARETRVSLDEILVLVEQTNAKVDQINGSVSAIMREIGGVPDPEFREPDRKTIRARIHELENDRAVEKAIRNSYDRAWSRWQKIALFAIAVAGSVMALLGLLGVGH